MLQLSPVVGSVVTTIEFVRLLFTAPSAAFPGSQLIAERLFILAVSLWLWFTVVFANFAEAMAEGRGKAQADTLRRARRDVLAKKLARPQHSAESTAVSAASLRQGDAVLVEAGDGVPRDGEVIGG